MSNTSKPPAWLPVAGWLPIVVYFAVKFLAIGRQNTTFKQNMLLIGFVVLAEVGLWQYRKQFRQPKKTDEDGTNQNG